MLGTRIKNQIILSWVVLLFIGCGARDASVEIKTATKLFENVDSLCMIDNGKLWGVNLYGPILIVNPGNRSVIANVSDKEGILKMEHGVFIGQLPNEINIANTAVIWGGVKWAMVSWDALHQNQKYINSKLLIHESWHRVQEEIGIDAVMSKNLHLDEEFGVILMKLELIALKNALSFNAGFKEDLKNALIIRKYRQKSFPANNENDFERHEGMAEYTGFKLCGIDSTQLFNTLVKYVDSAIEKEGFSNSFAYFTGPAYGFMLDKIYPGWLELLKQGKSLTEIASQKIEVDFAEMDSMNFVSNFNSIVNYYNADSIVNSVKENAKKNRKLAEYYEKKIFGENQLIIPNQNIKFSFNPQEKLISIRNGVVYKTLNISAHWGTIEVSDGIYRANDWSVFVVSAPNESRILEWDGYKLNLKENYSVVKISEGKFGISKNE